VEPTMHARGTCTSRANEQIRHVPSEKSRLAAQNLRGMEQIRDVPSTDRPANIRRYTGFLRVLGTKNTTGGESLGDLRGQDSEPQAARPPYRFFGPFVAFHPELLLQYLLLLR
jgi:hypothetical protein